MSAAEETAEKTMIIDVMAAVIRESSQSLVRDVEDHQDDHGHGQSATLIRESSQRRSSAGFSRPGSSGTLIPLGCRTTESSINI